MGFLAILLIGAGALMAYTGKTGRSPVNTLRAVLRGDPLASVPDSYPVDEVPISGKMPGRLLPDGSTSGFPGVTPQGFSPGSSALGSRIASDAQRYLGVPYRFGGHTPAGMDCSGLPTWVLHHDLGINLPDNTHTVVSEFRAWTGATTIGRSQIQPGDLVIYGTEHMGIAISSTEMVAAPHTGTNVRRQTIYYSPMPMFRRVKGA